MAKEKLKSKSNEEKDSAESSAPNHHQLDKTVPHQLQSSSSSEEESEESDSISKTNVVVRPPEPKNPPLVKTIPHQPQSSSSSEESEESDSVSNPNVVVKPSEPHLKSTIPIKSRGKEIQGNESKQLKIGSNSDSISKSNVVVKPFEPHLNPTNRTKRRAEEILGGESKQLKIGSELNITASSKKTPIKRIFSEEDEIIILKGVVNYTAKKQLSTITKFEEFYEFIKDDLDANVSKTQLQYKMQKLRKKYKNNKISKRQSFKKSHDQQLFDLSTKVWGNIGKEKTAIEDQKNDGNYEIVYSDQRPLFGYNKTHFNYGLSMEEKMSRIGAILFEGANDPMLEGGNKWNTLLLKEMKNFRDSLKLCLKKTNLVLNGLKKRCADNAEEDD